METKYRYNPKPAFEEQINALLTDKKDQEKYWKIIREKPRNSIRCNTLKITPKELKTKLEEENNWKISQPYNEHPEIMIIQSSLLPGEIGKSKPHLLGYYYVQELASMMPLLALKPNKSNSFFDCCASPGSKTTQAAAMMENKGILIANDNNVGRLMILASNLEKNGVSNTILTKKDGTELAKKLRKQNLSFDKILVDAPCSGEGTIRGTPGTFLMWNPKVIGQFSKRQKLLASKALEILKPGGTMIYSTCTHSPEENEVVVQHLLDIYDIELLPIKLPIKTRPGVSSWKDKTFSKELKNCARVYPQDNNTEGFFITKIKKLSENKKEEHKVD